jgi:hypothetical protein
LLLQKSKSNLNEPYFIFAGTCSLKYSEHEKEFLNRLQSLGEVILVANCDVHRHHGSLGNVELVLTRRNVGRDLAAYRDASRLLIDCNINADVVFLNSSCYWSIELLSKILFTQNSMRKIMFMTESFQRVEHFQTFYVFVPKELFFNFHNSLLESFKNWRLKRTIVERGEHSTRATLIATNLQSVALFPASQLQSSGRYLSRINPSIIFADRLPRIGAPFIKKTALIGNYVTEDVYNSFFKSCEI